MNFKKSKEEVLREIEANAGACIYSELNSMNMCIDTGSFAFVLQRAIARAVAEGFRTMLDNEYSDDDFERDITLKP